MRVWVIMGGTSAEREVSLASGRAVAAALCMHGHEVYAYELRDGAFLPEHSSSGVKLPSLPWDPASGQHAHAGNGAEPGWAERLLVAGRTLRDRADVAFLALHGAEGEDGTVQALLGALGVPYTGSGPAACAVAMDKVLTKRIMEALGIPTPAWALIELPPSQLLAAPPARALPLVVKPVAEGSSVGVSIVTEARQWPAALRAAVLTGPAVVPRTPRLARVLVEEFIAGRELTVGILGDEALPVVEILPRDGFYDYQRKYTPGESEYVVPARIPEDRAERLKDDALRLYRALGCRGMARVDFRASPQGERSCLELNAIPGLTETSLLPKAAGVIGLDFPALLEAVCRSALD